MKQTAYDFWPSMLFMFLGLVAHKQTAIFLSNFASMSVRLPALPP